MSLISNIKGNKSDLPKVINNTLIQAISTNKYSEGEIEVTIGTFKNEPAYEISYTRKFSWGYNNDLCIDVGKIKQYGAPRLIYIRPQDKNDIRTMGIDIRFIGTEKTNVIIDGYTFVYGNSFIKPIYDVDNIKRFTDCYFYGADQEFNIRNAHSDIKEVLFNGSNYFSGKSKSRIIKSRGFYNLENDSTLDLSEYAYKIRHIGL